MSLYYNTYIYVSIYVYIYRYLSIYTNIYIRIELKVSPPPFCLWPLVRLSAESIFVGWCNSMKTCYPSKISKYSSLLASLRLGRHFGVCQLKRAKAQIGSLTYGYKNKNNFQFNWILLNILSTNWFTWKHSPDQ
jgi:hypothetical protein